MPHQTALRAALLVYAHFSPAAGPGVDSGTPMGLTLSPELPSQVLGGDLFHRRHCTETLFVGRRITTLGHGMTSAERLLARISKAQCRIGPQREAAQTPATP